MTFLNQVSKAARHYRSRLGTFILHPSSKLKKPFIWRLCEVLIQTYEMYIPHMKKRSSTLAMEYEDRLYAVFSHASYRYTSEEPIKRINEFRIDSEFSDEDSVVFTNGMELGVVTRIVVSYRGTQTNKLDDILTDIFLTFGRETETERFKKAVVKIESLMEKFPLVPIVLCGHSLGGAQANHVAKKFSLPSYTYNPAQGISETYLHEINQFPKIRVYRIANDPVSCIAGLENVRGITLYPIASSINMIKNHSLTNFLPKSPIPSEYDMEEV